MTLNMYVFDEECLVLTEEESSSMYSEYDEMSFSKEGEMSMREE